MNRSHQACRDRLTIPFSWLNKLMQLSWAIHPNTCTHMPLAHSRGEVMSHEPEQPVTHRKPEDWNFLQMQIKERKFKTDTGAEMKPGLQNLHQQGGSPIPYKPDSYSQHQSYITLGMDQKNLGWGTMPAIWICLSMTSPSCCSKTSSEVLF